MESNKQSPNMQHFPYLKTLTNSRQAGPTKCEKNGTSVHAFFLPLLIFSTKANISLTLFAPKKANIS